MVIGVIDLGAYTDTYWTGGDPRPKWAMEKRFLKTYADLYRPSPQASTQLLRCCKVLYQEAFPILYGDNTFYFDWFFSGLAIGANNSTSQGYFQQSGTSMSVTQSGYINPR